MPQDLHQTVSKHFVLHYKYGSKIALKHDSSFILGLLCYCYCYFLVMSPLCIWSLSDFCWLFAFVFSLGCVYLCSLLPCIFDGWVLILDFYLHNFLLKDNFNDSLVLQIQLKNWIPHRSASISCTHQTDIYVKKVVSRVFRSQPFLISVFFLTNFIFFRQKWNLFFLLWIWLVLLNFWKNSQNFQYKRIEKNNPLFLIGSTLINKCLL